MVLYYLFVYCMCMVCMVCARIFFLDNDPSVVDLGDRHAVRAHAFGQRGQHRYWDATPAGLPRACLAEIVGLPAVALRDLASFCGLAGLLGGGRWALGLPRNCDGVWRKTLDGTLEGMGHGH